jgi:hypothetical protein
MAEVCSCGTRLVEDALFCHRCGKPTRDIVVPETVDQPTAAPPVVPELMDAIRAASAPQPSFHNPVATRIALGVGAVGALLMLLLPYLNFLGAGFFAAFFYRRRTGHPLNMESGVRLGWMTGIIMLPMSAIVIGGLILAMRSVSGMPGVPAEWHAELQQLNTVLQNRSLLVTALLQYLVFTMLLSMAGGALGAKISGRG